MRESRLLPSAHATTLVQEARGSETADRSNCQLISISGKTSAMKDAFDQWWEWVLKPLESSLTIPSDLEIVVKGMRPEDRRNREIRTHLSGPSTNIAMLAAKRCAGPVL
jgi:hypothetical protein